MFSCYIDVAGYLPKLPTCGFSLNISSNLLVLFSVAINVIISNKT